MLKVGILGCGKMGRLHAEIFSKNKNCQIAGLYNRTRGRALELQKNHPNARIYDNWQEMICDDSIDVITVSTPQIERKNQYLMAIEHEKHVFLEKPMGLGLDDLKEVLNSLERKDLVFYVDSQIQNQPAILAVNEEIAKLGRIIHVDMQYFMHRPDEMKWKHELIAGGGVLRELGGHMIDQAYEWLGKAKSVTSNNRIINPKRQVEDFTINIIEYENGATLLLTNNYYTHNGPLYRGKIIGTRGQIDFTFSSYNIADSSVTLFLGDKIIPIELNIPDKRDVNSVYPGFMDSFKKETNIFIDCILNHKKAQDTLAKEWNTQNIISAAYESSRSDRKVFLPLENFDISKLEDSFKVFNKNNKV